MRKMGLEGVIQGKTVRTTMGDKSEPCPLDHVHRQFQAPAPNRLWLSDFTYVYTRSGFVYVAFIIDAFARRIVGWRASRTAHTGFVLDALEQALYERSRWAVPDWFTTPTAAASTSPSNTARGWRSPASSPRWEAWGIPTTMPWPRLSTDFTRRS